MATLKVSATTAGVTKEKVMGPDRSKDMMPVIIGGVFLLLYSFGLIFAHPNEYDDDGRKVKAFFKFLYPIALIGYIVMCAYTFR